MILTTITSGFGNQLFQYAAGYALARNRKVPLRLNLNHYLENKHRHYELGRLCISAMPMNWTDTLRLNVYEASLRRRSVRWSMRALPVRQLKVMEDAVAGFDPTVLQQPDCSMLQGYWQNEDYFAHYREDILKQFTFRDPPDEQNEAMIRQIRQQPAVCVHVRRGDYLSPREILAPAPLDYYQTALQWMRNKVLRAKYFVFGDDPDWNRANLQIPDAVYVTHNTGKKDPEDLRLMSYCNHFIIANSTFSWWGAWLSTAADKQVIAPQRWFSKPNGNEDHIVPRAWLRM